MVKYLGPLTEDLKRKETHDKLDSHTRMYVFMGQMDSGRKGKIESEKEVFTVGVKQTQMALATTWRPWRMPLNHGILSLKGF